jgi:tetratricopeptide (TPR) repeat protein
MSKTAATGLMLVALALTGATRVGAQVPDELSRRQALEHYRRGVELLTAERYEQAAGEFTTAVGLNPLLTLAHHGRGQAFMALRRYASAIQAFLAGRTAHQTLADLHQRQVAEVARLQADEINELRDSVRRVRSQQVRVDAGTLFRIEQRLEELETLGRGQKFGQPVQVPAELSLALGSAYFRNGQPDDAEREWHAAVAVNPKLGEAHNNLAALYAMTGRKREAEAAVAAAERARYRVHPQLKADISRLD